MTKIAPGPDQATDAEGVSQPQPLVRWEKSDGGPTFQPTTTPPVPHGSRDMKMIDAWAVHEAVIDQACAAVLTTREWRLLTTVLSRTLRWQKIEDRVARSVMVERSGVAKSGIAASMNRLCALGFLTYVPGTGRSLGTVGVVIPEGWEKYRGVPDSGTPAVPESGTPAVPESGTPAVPESGTSDVPEAGTPAVLDAGTRTGGLSGGSLTGGKGGGTEPVTSLSLVKATSVAPTPASIQVAADAQTVVRGFLAAMQERGTPWTDKPAALEHGVRAALEHYDARQVLVGLGMWEAEQGCFPRQIPEWVRKAARPGPVPEHLTTAAALVTEGQERYRHYLARKETERPSKADVRRAASAAAIREFNARGAK